MLRELSVDSWYLDQPPAPLAHLRRLHVARIYPPPEGAAPLLRLADAAPRLDVLAWNGAYPTWWDGCPDPARAAAVEGHPCLRQLRVSVQDEAWLRAIPRLPALSTLALYMHPRLFEGKEVEGGASATAWPQRVSVYPAQCKRL